MFNLKEFLFTGFEKSLKEGSLGEGQVRMAAFNYMLKGVLTEEDLIRVEEIIKLSEESGEEPEKEEVEEGPDAEE